MICIRYQNEGRSKSSLFLRIWKYGPCREKTCLRGVANNTGADQPASAFVIRLFGSIIRKHATGEISIFWLVSVAEETGLKLALSETPNATWLILFPHC